MEVMTLNFKGCDQPISQIRHKIKDFSKIATILDVSYHVVPALYSKNNEYIDIDTTTDIDVIAFITYEDDKKVNEQQFYFIKDFFEEFIDKKTKTFKKDISEYYHEPCFSKGDVWEDDFWSFELAQLFFQGEMVYCTPKQIADVFNAWVNE